MREGLGHDRPEEVPLTVKYLFCVCLIKLRMFTRANRVCGFCKRNIYSCLLISKLCTLMIEKQTLTLKHCV